jgi:uncharacterized protein DUF1707
MTATPKDMSQRVSEEDRDTAVERVQRAFAEEHITAAEMDERLHVALTAPTHGELATALSSLPDEDAGRTVAVDAVGGRIRRRGAWRVPRVFKVESKFGKVDVDLSRAVVESSVVDIELRLQFGSARIVLPRDATVDYEGLSAAWKQPVDKAPRRGGSGGPHIRISGVMEYGRLTIRHRRH